MEVKIIVLIKIINLLNFILPKNNQRVSIISFPDFDDQTRGILNYLDTKEVVILVSRDHKYRPYWLGKNVCIKKKNSFLVFSKCKKIISKNFL